MNFNNDDDDDNQARKKRGPYKRYLEPGSNIPVPESTLRDRKKRAKLQQEQDTNNGDFNQQSDDVQAGPSHDVDDGSSEEQEVDDPRIEHEDILSPSESVVDEDETSDFSSDQGREEQDSDEVPTIETEPKKPSVDYVKKYNLNAALHKVTEITRLDALLMILHMAVRHCHTEKFIEHMIAFVNALFGEVVLDISYHIFKNLFPPASSIIRHYFCPDCEIYLGSSVDLKDVKEKACMKCKKMIDVSSVDSGNYFITLSLKEQIETLLNKPGIKLVQNRSPNADLCDIFDGEIFKSCQQQGLPLQDSLTVTFNTDGVNIHESTKNTLWPIFLYVNEIIPELRFLVNNLILAGLWFGRNAPNMALFLKPFLKELLSLSQDGVRVSDPNGGVKIYRVFPVACSVDSVAKPKLVCQKQFNAYCGCLYCEHPNDAIVDMISKQRFYDTSSHYPLRTEEKVIKDMYEADKQDREGVLKDGSVNGFLGVSVLLLFARICERFPCNPFSIIWSVVYMHCSLEGVCDDLLNIYLGILNTEKIKILNIRIAAIRPPQAMTRKPRALIDKIKWKAKEFRAFLLYYSLPCLEDLLPSTMFSNLKLFVHAMHILLSDRITQVALAEAKSALEKFTTGFQQIYGLSKVTYNLHLLTHYCDLVKKLGPLWCYSNFVFESGNGRLIKLIRGTRSIINEMAVKYTKLQNVSQLIAENPVGKKALSFCNDLLNLKYSKSARRIDDCCLTSSSIIELTAEECSLLESSNVSVNGNTVTYYHRVIRKGIVYCSAAYAKTNVFDDSCVRLYDNKYVYIDKIVKSNNNEILCIVKPIYIARDLIPSVKQCSFDCFGDIYVIPFSDVSRKCFFVSFSGKNFVCNIPNFYERD